MAEKAELLGQGGEDGQGQDDAGGYLGLRVIFVLHGFEGIVYDVGSRREGGRRGGLPCLGNLPGHGKGGWQLGLE